MEEPRRISGTPATPSAIGENGPSGECRTAGRGSPSRSPRPATGHPPRGSARCASEWAMPGDERRLAEGIVARALEASLAPETEVTVSGSAEALTRFAGSVIHQNLSRSLLTVSLR